MYVVREIHPGEAMKTTLVSQEIGEVLRHIEAEQFQFIMEIVGTYTFDRADGATASITVEDVTAA